MNQNDLHDEMNGTDDWLAKAMQRQERYIADDGFTDSVMASLPALESRTITHAEPVSGKHEWIVLAAAGAAAATVAAFFPLMPFVDLITASARIPMIACGAAVAAGALFCATTMMRKAL